MGRIRLKRVLRSAEETIAFGKEMAIQLQKGGILALYGDLGAGKTTFVQGLALGLGIFEPIQSPTFVLLNVYSGLYHFDLYRLKGETDFTNLGFEEYFDKKGICAIEWPDRIANLLPPETIYVTFNHEGNGRLAWVRQ
jgi:tRNA threonylcarbamoyladenosine biosynthesis protein TsaE